MTSERQREVTVDAQIKIVAAPRPDSKDEGLAYLASIRNGLTERQRLAFDNGNLVECEVCAAKPGTPTLCASCLANRYIIEMLTPSQRRKLIKRHGAYFRQVSKK
jgi:hypothetical protein